MSSWLDRFQRAALLVTAALFSAGYGTVGLALLLVTVVLEAGMQRRLPWQRTPVDLAAAVFLGIFLLSGYVSDYRPTAIASTGLGALTIYLALGVSSRVLTQDPGLLRPLVWTWLAGAAVAAAWAIVLHLRSGAPAFLPELGQNAVGTTMLIGGILGTGLYLSSAGTRRYAAAGLTALAIVALVFSYTRGAWLGAAAGLALIIGTASKPAARRAAGVAVVVIIVTLVVAGGERPALLRRVLSIPNVSANLMRVYIFRAAGAIILDHPVLGTGMNTFPIVYPRYRLPADPNPPDARPNAHNIFLNFAAEGGLMALAAFVLVVAQTLISGWRWRAAAPTETDRILRTALVAAFVGMMIHQLVDGTLLSVHLGAGMWMTIAILTLPLPHARDQRRHPHA